MADGLCPNNDLPEQQTTYINYHDLVASSTITYIQYIKIIKEKVSKNRKKITTER